MGSPRLSGRKPFRKSFRPGGSALLLAIVSLIAAALAWAATSEIDEVKRGMGKVIPSGQIQVVQSSENGVIRKIHVREGSKVQTDDLLMELDPTILQSQLNQSRQQHNSLSAKIIRLTAQVKGVEPVFPRELESQAAAVVNSERTLHLGRKNELQSEMDVLQGQLYQRQQELCEAQVAQATAERGIGIIQSEIAIIKPLVQKGIEPELSLLQLQRQFSELKGKHEAAALVILRTTAAIKEVSDKSRTVQEKHRSEALTQLAQATAQISELQQTLPALESRLAHTEVRAPVRGVVNRLLMPTTGGVVQTGTPLVEVVPLDDTLLVEASIKPSDIAFLHPGQKVRVKITAYDYTRYGGLDGHVETISADAVKNQSSGETMYLVRVRTDSTSLTSAGDKIDIMPGMIAEVDILTEKRTVLDYIIRPVMKAKSKAFSD